MAARVKEDLVEGHEYNEDKDGGQLVRVFKVYDLTRGPSTLIDARRAVNLDYASRHPNDRSLYVTNIKVLPVNNAREQAKVLVTYKTPDSQGSGPLPAEGVLRWHGGVRQIETERYADRKLILINYSDGTTTYEPQVGRVSQPEQYGILSYEKEMTTNPEPFFYLQGSINGAPYRGRDKWSWMCTDFDADYYLRRRVFRVSISLEWSQLGHWTPVMFTDKVTGLVPKSIVEDYNRKVGRGLPRSPTGNGWVIKLYGPEEDFNQFGLPTGGITHVGGNF